MRACCHIHARLFNPLEVSGLDLAYPFKYPGDCRHNAVFHILVLVVITIPSSRKFKHESCLEIVRTRASRTAVYDHNRAYVTHQASPIISARGLWSVQLAFEIFGCLPPLSPFSSIPLPFVSISLYPKRRACRIKGSELAGTDLQLRPRWTCRRYPTSSRPPTTPTPMSRRAASFRFARSVRARVMLFHEFC